MTSTAPEEGGKSRRDRILGTVEDLVASFLYYGRKEDENLPVGAVEEAVRAGELSADDIVTAFRACLEAGLSS